MNSTINPLELGGIIGICIVLAQGLIGITKTLIERKLNGHKGNDIKSVQFLEEQRIQLKELHDIHFRFDDNGAPLWYVPRSLSTNLSKVADLLGEINIKQEQQNYLLDKLLEKLS